MDERICLTSILNAMRDLKELGLTSKEAELVVDLWQKNPRTANKEKEIQRIQLKIKHLEEQKRLQQG